MTLHEWEQQSGETTHLHPSGARWIAYASLSMDDYRELFHLSDYLVSSVIGGTVWLVPRQGVTA